MTISDIATALGVSKSCVSHAITGNGRISPQTRERIMAYMDAHHFRPNVIAQSLANQKTYNIAFTVPGKRGFGETPFFQDCLVSVCEKASANGYDVLVVAIEDDDISQMQRLVANKKVDGIILSRNLDDDRVVRYLQKHDVPFVLLGTLDNPDVVQVDNDHVAACGEMTSAFLHKRRRMGLIGGNHKYVVNQNRYRGFQQAAAAFGEVRVIWDAVDAESIVTAYETLRSEGVCVIFCMDDVICRHLVQYLHRTGQKIPDDVEPVSFYDNWYLEAHTPPIPALSFSASELGEIACGLLLKILAGESVPKRTLGGYRLLRYA